jgi:hypothetical protein
MTNGEIVEVLGPSIVETTKICEIRNKATCTLLRAIYSVEEPNYFRMTLIQENLQQLGRF